VNPPGVQLMWKVLRAGCGQWLVRTPPRRGHCRALSCVRLPPIRQWGCDRSPELESVRKTTESEEGHLEQVHDRVRAVLVVTRSILPVKRASLAVGSHRDLVGQD